MRHTPPEHENLNHFKILNQATQSRKSFDAVTLQSFAALNDLTRQAL
jgi:hypothetical protein